MANFVFEDYNSMPEQVEENKKNIKELIKFIKPVYKSNVALTTSSISVAISDTNAPSDTIQGWLIDENGLFFQITNGDGTNLLIDYYATLKGDTGATGQDGADGTNGTNGTDGTGVILLHDQQLTIGQTSIILDSYFSQLPKFNDVVLDENGTIGTVTNIIGSDVYVLGEFSIKGANGQNGADGTTYGLIAFSNIAVDDANFVSSLVYTDYPYECVVLQTNQLINKIVSGGMVTFDVDEANSGNYASICNVDTTTGEITIYAKAIPSGDFTIPSIWVVAE